MSIESGLRSGLLLLVFISQTIYAAQLFGNGDFEFAALGPWTDQSEAGGVIKVISAGKCYAGLDTRSLSIRGAQAAALSAPAANPSNANAILRSGVFTAGDGFAFIALTATPNNAEPDYRPPLQVHIIDAQSDKLLANLVFSPGHVSLDADCPAQARPVHADPGQFSSHYVSTRAYSGREIRIQFVLEAEKEVSISFVFIDQVVNFEQAEQPLFYSRPYAQAGLLQTNAGLPYLSAMGSFDPDLNPSPLSYTWYVNNHEYRTSSPCLEGFTQGNYHAVLYVNDGHYAMSDDTWFYIAEPGKAPQEEQKECQMLPMKAAAPQPRIENVLAMPEVAAPASPVSAIIMDEPASGSTPSSSATISPDSAPAPVSEAIPDAWLTRKAYTLNRSGIRWQPSGAAGGKLRVITPEHYSQQTLLLLSAQGQQLETATFIEQANQGFTYHFKKAGSAYPPNSILRVGHTDYLVTTPAKGHH